MADKEKLTIKIMQEPKYTPCHYCEKDCIGEEYLECDKLKAHNGKIIALEYDRQEAINIIAKAMCMQDNLLESCKHCITQCDKQKQKNMCEHILKKRKDNIEPSYFDKAKAALNALLEGIKN